MGKFREKLALLDQMLRKMNATHARIAHLKRGVFVLRALLRDGNDLPSPYGPDTPFTRFSVQ